MRREVWRTTAAEECFTVSGGFEATARAGVITGIASIFGSLVSSSMGAVVEPGAFTASLRQRPQVPVLWQ
jgi:phage head maturation protease